MLPPILFVLALMVAPREKIWRKITALIIFGVIAFIGMTNTLGVFVAEVDTLYNHVRVVDTKDPRTGERLRTLAINIENHSTTSLDSDRLVNEYTKYYHLARHFFPDFQSALMLG
jgi:hypothetical protein